MPTSNPNIFTEFWEQIRVLIWGDILRAEEVAELLEEELLANYSTILDSISEKRVERLQVIIKYLQTKGFPYSVSDCAELSIIPFILHELNVTDINWKSRNANLKQLTVLLDADFLIQNKGKKRLRVTNKEFQDYLDHTKRYIDYWKNKISLKTEAILYPPNQDPK